MKRIFTILCALAIVMAGSATALAAEPEAGQSASYYPVSVEEYTYGDFDELRINKTYQLSLADDPSLIPTEDFIRNGRRYYLLDMTRKDEVGVDIQTHTETITQASDTNNLETILQRLDAEMEVTTEDGYVGILRLDHTSVQVTTDGYATKTSTLTASRSYPNSIFERILYTLPPEPERRPAKPLQKGHEVFQERQAPEREAPEQVQVRHRERQPSERRKPALKPQEAPVRPPQPQREVSQRSPDQGRQEAPVAQRQENKGKNGSRSERDSHVTKISSSIPKESGAMRGTSERPSIEARLQGYRAQMRRPSAPAKVRSKTKSQAKAR